MEIENNVFKKDEVDEQNNKSLKSDDICIEINQNNHKNKYLELKSDYKSNKPKVLESKNVTYDEKCELKHIENKLKCFNTDNLNRDAEPHKDPFLKQFTDNQSLKIAVDNIYKNNEFNNLEIEENKTYDAIMDKKIDLEDTNISTNEFNSLFRHERSKYKKLKREPFGDPSCDNFKGPWAKFIDPEINNEANIKLKNIENDINNCLNISNPHFIAKKETSKYFGECISGNKISPISYLRRSAAYNKYLENVLLRIPKVLDLTITEHKRSVRKLSFLKRYSNLLVSGGLDGKIFLIETFKEKKVVRSFLGHSKGISGIKTSLDGKRLVSSSYDGFVKEWDTETGKCRRRVDMKINVMCLESFNDNLFFIGTYDGAIKLLDMRTNKIENNVNFKSGMVRELLFLENSNLLLSCFEDKNIRVIHDNLKCIIEFKSVNGFSNLAYNQKKRNIFFREGSEALKFIDSASLKFIKKDFKIFDDNGFLSEIDVSPDGMKIFSGDKDGKVVFYDWDTNKCLRKIQMHRGPVRSLLWNDEDVSKFASGGDDNFVHIWR